MSKLIADIPLSSIAAMELRVSRCRETLAHVAGYARGRLSEEKYAELILAVTPDEDRKDDV